MAEAEGGAEERAMRALRAMGPAQLEFLAEFSSSYVNGKKLLCWGARAIVALGMLAGAIAGIVTAVNAVLALRGH